MPSEEGNPDDHDRAVTVESEAYNWVANGGTPPDGIHVGEVDRSVETDPGVAFHYLERTPTTNLSGWRSW